MKRVLPGRVLAWLERRQNQPVLTAQNKLRIPSLEFFLINTCNLRCRHCAASSPFLRQPDLPNLDGFRQDLAALADAQRQLARSRDLMAQNFISQGAVDTNQTLVDSQQAVVASDQAAIQAAQVGLSYNRITAPAAGRARW